MLLTILLIIGGLLLLAAGAESLVRGSAGAALRFGVTPMAIGLTVVAFGTGSPELAVSVEAAYTNNGGIALGNVVGSNIPKYWVSPPQTDTSFITSAEPADENAAKLATLASEYVSARPRHAAGPSLTPQMNSIVVSHVSVRAGC
jgi:hypothetical protein